MNKSKELHKLKQSIWFDNIDRKLINDGWLKEQIKDGVIFGLTSNPSIFKKSISGGGTYSLDIQTMSIAGFDTKKIFEELVAEDIRGVADLLKPTYLKTNRIDGYVSLEVDPALANETARTVTEAKRLWKLVDRKNLMIKIPATPAGIFAIRETIASGINVNVTLIFSVQRYLEVINAYMTGLEERIDTNQPIDEIHSVASFFVSRLDVKLESKISELIQSGNITEKDYQSYLGKPAIINGLYAYHEFEKSINAERFMKISENQGNIQRLLWASTGTKNDKYSDVLYVEGLILPHTVNTVPPKTLSAFLDHGTCKVVDLSSAKEEFLNMIKDLENLGVDFPKVWAELEKEGVAAFSNAQKDLISVLDSKRYLIIEALNGLKTPIKERVKKLKSEDFSRKYFVPVTSLWTNDPSEAEEIIHRMGWVDAPIVSREIVSEAEKLLSEVKSEGYSHALVLGMGGSSLAPEVFSKVFKNESGIHLTILDSTDPMQIDKKVKEIPVDKTLFILSSKSGTTAEVRTLFAYFWGLVERIDRNLPGDHFIAITDPGTQLEDLGNEKKFRKIFNADADVGGRYSALIAFGIVPAVLAGVDGHALLVSANQMREKCGESIPVEKNPGIILGIMLAEANNVGRDKLTILTDDPFNAFGSWLEQLVAESSGKTGKGIIPVDLEPKLPVKEYSNDRIFYYLRGEGNSDEFINTLVDNNHPVIVSQINDTFDIGGEIYKWEVAITTACSIIGVNPFNQPNVQESKAITNKMIDALKLTLELEEEGILYSDDSIAVFGNFKKELGGKSLTTIISQFLIPSKGDYIAIIAFLPRIDTYEEALQQLRNKLLMRFSVPVTLGFGPRFLHSTGQLHKGGRNNGIFLIITQEPTVDFDIPDEGMRFSTLERAQALGDMKALEQNKRRVLRIHLRSHSLPFTDIDKLFEGN